MDAETVERIKRLPLPLPKRHRLAATYTVVPDVLLIRGSFGLGESDATEVDLVNCDVSDAVQALAEHAARVNDARLVLLVDRLSKALGMVEAHGSRAVVELT